MESTGAAQMVRVWSRYRTMMYRKSRSSKAKAATQVHPPVGFGQHRVKKDGTSTHFDPMKYSYDSPLETSVNNSRRIGFHRNGSTRTWIATAPEVLSCRRCASNGGSSPATGPTTSSELRSVLQPLCYTIDAQPAIACSLPESTPPGYRRPR